MGYLLSIVVPTKDRYPYLKQLISLVKSFKSDDIELVIQDNTADNAEFLDFLTTQNYEHLKYFHKNEPVSVSDNSTFAILNSTGEYVCFIGDDDGVTHFIVDAVKWMKENNINILKSAFSIHKWPSFNSSKYYPISGTAIFNDYTMTYRIVDNKECLVRLLTAGINTLEYMPKLYNGITKRSSLEKIYQKCGTYFPGPSPDMANAVALAIEENSYAFVDAPIIIGGHSGHLGGNASRYKNKCGPLEEQPFIDREYIDNWNQRIPKVWAATTIWPASAITALEAYGATEYLNMVNYEEILRRFIVANPDKKEMAYALSSNPTKLQKSGGSGRLIHVIKGCYNVFKFIVFNIYDGMKVHKNVKNIAEAEKIFTIKISEFKLVKNEKSNNIRNV